MTREPIQIVEIDFDTCTQTYGSAPCTATLTASSVRKCFNTYFTCQDTANFTKGTQTLRFSKNQNGIPPGVLVYPSLVSVSTNPTQINLGGDKRLGSFGKRARVKITLQDFDDNDTGTDPYQAERVTGAAQFSGSGYKPEAFGTFWGRLRRRTPYYVGREIRILDGYVGETLAAMRSRAYVITEIDGPDLSGRVMISAKDVLDLADNDKALCPAVSEGKIETDITAAAYAVVDLLPAGIGADYAASGRANIGSEIVEFTRATDTVTLTERGMDGTTAAAHSADDLFQQCYRAEGQTIESVAEDLLVNYAGIDASYISTTDWAEQGLWTSGLVLTGTIPKPTGVIKLMTELSDLGVTFWWDEVAQQIKMRATRPVTPDDVILSFTDTYDIKEGSLSNRDLTDQRVTQVIFWHGQIDATKSATSGENYARAFVSANDGGSTNEHNQDRQREIYCRWFGEGNDAAAGAIAERWANRFEEIPSEVTIVLDAKDRENVAVGNLVTITTRALQDEIGQSIETEAMITSVEENQPGHAIKVTVQTYSFSGRFGFWLEDPQPFYDTASAADLEFGAFWFNDTVATFTDGTGPYLYF